MPALMYGQFPLHCALGEVDLGASDVKALLVNNYVFDQDAHARVSHVSSKQVSGEGYAPGGIVVQNLSVEYDPAVNRTRILCDDLNYPTMTLPSFGGAIFYVDAGADPVLIAYHGFGARGITEAPFTYYLVNRTIAQFTVS